MKIKNLAEIVLLIIFLWAASAVRGQIAAGGDYRLEQAVIASGGGASVDSNTAGGAYSLIGTSGQAIAGTRLNNAPYKVSGGFWANINLPTAANINIGGRLVRIVSAANADSPNSANAVTAIVDSTFKTNAAVRGVSKAIVWLTSQTGDTRQVTTDFSGGFNFANVHAGEIYILSVAHKRFTFAPQLITANDDITHLILTAEP